MKKNIFLIVIILLIISNSFGQDFKINTKAWSKKGGRITNVLAEKNSSRNSITFKITIKNENLKSESYILDCEFVKDKEKSLGHYGYPETIDNLDGYQSIVVTYSTPDPFRYTDQNHHYDLVFYIKEKGISKRTIHNYYFKVR